MIELNEALDLVIKHAGRQDAVSLPMDECLGLILAENVISDIDSPPFDKSMMDGFAVRTSDIASGKAELELQGEIAAGVIAKDPLEAGKTYQIMTGAPIPSGADAVIVVEKSKLIDGRVSLDDPKFRAGQNIIPKGSELQHGQTVLTPGHTLGAAEIGLLATVGYSFARVHRRPSVATLATGDEIVPHTRKPGIAQIRNSNEATILSLARNAGAEAWSCGIAKDDRADLVRLATAGLDSDILVLSGGVSAGKKDFVPSVLAELGVEMIFHKVAIKPGKPVWFGKSSHGGLVFGLPGNPASVFVCFELFVRTAIKARSGFTDPKPRMLAAKLAADVAYQSDRVTFHPAKYRATAEGLIVDRVDWFGSADLRALTSANCFVEFPVAETSFRAGQILRIIPMSE